MLYIIFSVWLRTGSNPTDIIRIRSHTGKYVLLPKTWIVVILVFSSPSEISVTTRMKLYKEFVLILTYKIFLFKLNQG